jgi:hypothetical protein
MKNIRRNLASAIACVLMCAVFTTGCTTAQKQTTLQVVQKINTYAPAIVDGIDAAATTIATLDPAIGAVIMIGVTALDTLQVAFTATLSAYLANPNATTLTALQSAINALESNINTASLNALHITDPISQRLALAGLKTVLSLVTIVFSLISQTETVAQLDQLRMTDTIHLALLRPQMNEALLEAAVRDNGAPTLMPAKWSVDYAFNRASDAGF